MQKVLVNCQVSQKDEIIHILKVNNYKPTEFMNENEIILFFELYDYQISLLVKLIHDYMKTHHCEVSVSVCHKITFYE